MFPWKNFWVLYPRLVKFKAVKPEMLVVVGGKEEKTTKYKPRWAGMKAKTEKMLSKVTNFEKNYNFRPYFILPSWDLALQFYSKESKETAMMPRTGISPTILVLYHGCFCPPTLKLESKERTVSYNPKG